MKITSNFLENTFEEVEKANISNVKHLRCSLHQISLHSNFVFWYFEIHTIVKRNKRYLFVFFFGAYVYKTNISLYLIWSLTNVGFKGNSKLFWSPQICWNPLRVGLIWHEKHETWKKLLPIKNAIFVSS